MTNPIATFTATNHSWPHVYSDHAQPAHKPTEEPICEVGDVVTTSGPWADPQTAAVLEVSGDFRTIWIAVPGPGGDRTAIGAHNVARVVRGASEWVRTAPPATDVAPAGTPPSLSIPEELRLACDVAAGNIASDSEAVAVRVRAAHRDLNAKGNGTEWHRMVWRGGEWRYFADGRMPTRKFLASERRVSLYGDVYPGEIVCDHDRGARVDTVYVVHSSYVDKTGDEILMTPVEFRRARNGLQITLPTGSAVTRPDPRSR